MVTLEKAGVCAEFSIFAFPCSCQSAILWMNLRDLKMSPNEDWWPIYSTSKSRNVSASKFWAHKNVLSVLSCFIFIAWSEAGQVKIESSAQLAPISWASFFVCSLKNDTSKKWKSVIAKSCFRVVKNKAAVGKILAQKLLRHSTQTPPKIWLPFRQWLIYSQI